MNKTCSPFFVFLSSRGLLLCSHDTFVRYKRHQSDWAHSWQVSPGTSISQLTNRGKSTTSIPLTPCAVHSYWCICQVHQSWEKYDKYSLDSLCSPQLLVYLSSTPVMGTVRQVFPWFLVQSTVTGVLSSTPVMGKVRQVFP